MAWQLPSSPFRRGLRVIGTASAGKRGFVDALGVIHIEPGPGIADRVLAAAPDGVDAIYDLVGGDALAEVASVLRDRSKLITCTAPRNSIVR